VVVLQAACDYEAVAVYVNPSEWCQLTVVYNLLFQQELQFTVIYGADFGIFRTLVPRSSFQTTSFPFVARNSPLLSVSWHALGHQD
jgi:hypothetical protein